MADEEQGRSSLGRSLSARLRRKEQVARGEAVPEMPDEELPATDPAETDEDAALTDEELLAKYELDDPETIEDESRLDALLEGKFPDRIRQMALRRMWRLNPMFRFADEMVEYGENYTDAATVIDGMTTAYQVGKGYLQKAFDAVEDAPSEGLPEPSDAAPSTLQEDAPEVTEAAEQTGVSDGDSEASQNAKASSEAPGHSPAQQPESAELEDKISADPEQPPRARRMVFRKSESS